MTWQHCSRAALAAILGMIALPFPPQAQAENSLISPQEAEALVRAHREEVKAAEAALQSERDGIEAEDAAQEAKSAKKKAKGATEKRPEETVSLPVALPALSRSQRADAAKASALKPLIVRYASENGLPYELADAVVRLESRYNAGARNGPNVGLTQINVLTAQSLGYKGDAAGLFDAETNLRFGLKYLAAAYRLAGGDTCGTILRYQAGLRATKMTAASRAYCAKVKVLTASAE